MRFQVMKVVLRLVKSFSGPPEPGSRYDGPGPASPSQAASGLRGNDVTKVLQRIEKVHRAVLCAVFVSGDKASAHPAVVRILSVLIEQVARRVESLDDLGRDGGLFSQPDRSSDDENVGGHHAF